MEDNDRLVNELRAQMKSGEELEAYLIGGLPLPYKSVLAMTEKKLVCYRKTLTGFRLETVPYSQISSVNASKGIFGHSIIAYGANNSIGLGLIKQSDERVEKFIVAIRQRVSEIESSNEGAPKEDISALLLELNQLRQQGLITEEEFTAKKRNILGI